MNSLLRFMKAHGDINEQNEKIIMLGMHRIIGYLSDFTLVILISAIWGILLEGLLFQVVYIAIRIYAGGYHADNKIKCIVISLMSTIFCLFSIRFVNLNNNCWILIAFISWAGISILAPIESKNKPITITERKVFRNRARLFSTISLLFAVISFFYQSTSLKAVSIAMCSVLVGLLLVSPTMLQKKQKVLEGETNEGNKKI